MQSFSLISTAVRSGRSVVGRLAMVMILQLAGSALLGVAVQRTMNRAIEVNEQLARETELANASAELQGLLLTMRLHERDAVSLVSDPNTADLRVAAWEAVGKEIDPRLASWAVSEAVRACCSAEAAT